MDSSGPKDAQVQSYSPDGANVPSLEDTLPPPGEYEWMARWNARAEFLLSVIELLFLSLTVEAL